MTLWQLRDPSSKNGARLDSLIEDTKICFKMGFYDYKWLELKTVLLCHIVMFGCCLAPALRGSAGSHKCLC